MKQNPCISMVLVVSICAVLTASATAEACPSARSIDPIVSTDWLSANSSLEGLVVLDVRPSGAYDVEHIPGSINEPFAVPISAWSTMPDSGLLLELPPAIELFDTIGALGIGTGSKVVVVSAPNPGEPPHYGLSAATRVAVTLIYTGVVDVAVLDGGYPKWVADGLPVSTDDPLVEPVVFDGFTNDRMFVSMNYVESRVWWANIVDGRDADVYYGVTIEPFAPVAGHIMSAVSLPAPWMYDGGVDDVYTLKPAEQLREMASGTIRDNRCDGTHHGWMCPDTIVYCGVGGYASVLWYVLSEMLGYKNVRFYDGSAQEWSAANDMVAYQWW